MKKQAITGWQIVKIQNFTKIKKYLTKNNLLNKWKNYDKIKNINFKIR